MAIFCYYKIIRGITILMTVKSFGQQSDKKNRQRSESVNAKE